MVPEIQMPQDGFVFIESALFEVMADKLLGTKGRDALQSELLEHPESGKPIEETNGARKLRVALDGRGKKRWRPCHILLPPCQGRNFLSRHLPEERKRELVESR
jgi:hypothetical protein